VAAGRPFLLYLSNKNKRTTTFLTSYHTQKDKGGRAGSKLSFLFFLTFYPTKKDKGGRACDKLFFFFFDMLT
jgi:hypothetical protein